MVYPNNCANNFVAASRKAIQDPVLRASVAQATNTAAYKRQIALFAYGHEHAEVMRQQAAEAKRRALSQLPELFIEQAQKLNCAVQVCGRPEDAVQYFLALIGTDKLVSSWDADFIPLPGLVKKLADAEIKIAPPNDPAVRIGITGANAALAETGSLVLASGPGKSCLVSLLPFIHVAVITSNQILPNMEAWAVRQRDLGLEYFRQTSNILLISGPSRTADIAMELVLGAHGPAEVHILIIP